MGLDAGRDREGRALSWRRPPGEACRPQIAALVLLGVVAAVFLFQTYGKAQRESGNDFTSYLLSSAALADHGNPYDTASPFPYVYPALLAMLLLPLTWIPYGLAVLLWFAASLAALFVSIRVAVSLCSERIGTGWGLQLAVPLATCALLLLTPIQNNLLNGQVNFLVLLLCLLFVADLETGRGFRASLWLALATAIKLTPAIFLLYLLRRRRYGVTLAFLATVALLCVLPVLVAGPGVIALQLDLARGLADAARRPPSFPGDYPPFGLAGVAGWLFPWLHGSTALLVGSTMLVLLILVWIDRRAEKGGDSWTAQLYLAAMLLVAPWSEKHHLAFLMPPAVIVSLVWIRRRPAYTLPARLLLVFFWAALVLGNRMTSVPLHFAAILTLCRLLAGPLRPERPSRASPRRPQAGTAT